MKKQTNLHTIKFLSLEIVAAITIIVGATILISAQEERTYNVGDRVEADPIGLQKWRKTRSSKFLERLSSGEATQCGGRTTTLWTYSSLSTVRWSLYPSERLRYAVS